MRELRIRNTQEEEKVKRAVADSLVMKRHRRDPTSRVMTLTDDSMKRLFEFSKEKGLPNTIPGEYLEQLYHNTHARDVDYILARKKQDAIERELVREPVLNVGVNDDEGENAVIGSQNDFLS